MIKKQYNGMSAMIKHYSGYFLNWQLVLIMVRFSKISIFHLMRQTRHV
uniref:Uncharacterized protein n=1 Tax=Anguilla anguilla TaxID=7936 RepID=A0A0E9PUH5_ANGAN